MTKVLPDSSLQRVPARAAATYFGLVFGTGFVLGLLRVPSLVPRLGVRISELLEAPLMLVAIVLSARFVVTRYALEPTPASRLPVGFIALALLLLAEVAVVYLVQRQSLVEYIAGRDPVSGSVYLAMLALFALMPLLVCRGVRQA